MSYQIDGRQFIVIAAGGHDRLPTTPGDYVMAFTLPAEPSAGAARPVEPWGTYEGHLVFGLRYFVRLTLTGAEDAVRGELRGVGSGLEGTLSGRWTPPRLTYEISFDFPEESCSGLLSGTLEAANGGRMLVGHTELTGDCADSERERGWMAFRRR